MVERNSKGQILGYARVSDPSQNVARQIEALEKYGVDKIYIDKASGKDPDREEMQALLNYVRAGDTIVIKSLDRLMRSVVHMTTLTKRFEEELISLVVLDNGLVFDFSKPVNERDPYRTFQLNLLSSIGELERSLIKSRQAEGIRLAREAGVYKGRQKIEIKDFEKHYAEYLEDKEMSKVALAKKLGISRPTLYRKIAEVQAKGEKLGKDLDLI